MNECKCGMREKLMGDGCKACNPLLALNDAQETIAQQKIKMRMAAHFIQEMCFSYSIPLPKDFLDELLL